MTSTTRPWVQIPLSPPEFGRPVFKTGFSFIDIRNCTSGLYREWRIELPEKSINIRLNKALGQNFLKGERVARRIVEYAETVADIDFPVVEIGVGSGTLTKVMLERGFKVTGYEIDRRFAEQNRRLEGSRCQILYEDFLKADIAELPDGISYVANIPYYITSPIIERIMFEGPVFCSALLMVQKEYADRLTASPGTKEYGILTVNVRTFALVNSLFQVSRKEFFPEPDVDSTVIELKLLSSPYVVFEKRNEYRSFVRACFAQRRKKLKNNLKAVANDPERLLLDCGIGASVRAEELCVDDFVRLFNALANAAPTDGRFRG